MTDPKSRRPGQDAITQRRVPMGAILGIIASIVTIAAFGLIIFDRLNSSTTSGTRTTVPSIPSSTLPPPDPMLAIHAGYQVEKVIEAAGSPIVSRALPGEPGWVEQLFAHGSYAATVLVSPTNKIVLYSVLVCDRSLAPTFTTPAHTRVTLMGVPISRAESATPADQGLNNRPLFYLDGETGNSLGQLIEVSVDQPRSGNGNRGYLVGINRACGDTAFGSKTNSENNGYRGSIDDAPAEIQAFRKKTPANFYAEVIGDFSINNDGTVDIQPQDNSATIVGVLASPFIHELPAQFLSQAGSG